MQVRRRSLIRFRPSRWILCAAMLGLAVIVSGCGGGKMDGKSTADTGEKSKTDRNPPANKKPPAGTPEAEAVAALGGAISALQAKDFKSFLTNYAPQGFLRNKTKGEGVDRLARRMSDFSNRQPGALPAVIGMLKKYQKITPTFDTAKSKAMFKIVTAPAGTTKAGKTPLSAVKNANLQVTGYGGDLKAALKQALADVKAGKFATYLQKMLPVSELKLNSVDDLAKHIATSKSTSKQIVADLTAMQSATPALDSGGTVATMTVSPRVFKLQKVDGNWRLFDNTTGLQTALSGVSRETKESAEVFTLEKTGGQWRFTRESMDVFDRAGRKVRRRSVPPRRKVRSKGDLPKGPVPRFKR